MASLEDVVMGLEEEFRRALQGIVTLTAFTHEIGKFLDLMGFTDFSVLHWNLAGHYRRNPPKPLIKNSSDKAVNRALCNLLDTAVAQQGGEILQACYEETKSPVDPQESAVRRSSYRLTTNSGNYAYFIRKGSQTSSCQQVLCIFDSSKEPSKFLKNIERHHMALDAMNKVVEDIGIDRFPGLFAVSESEDKINIGSKPLRLLNIIAQDDVTLNQAASILDISVDTANKHIAKIKSELGVSTLPSAVFYAANKGLIDRVL